LEKAIKSKEVFDAIDRSERGRTITTAFFIDLGSGPLPKIKAGDDAKLAKWIPLNDLFSQESSFFEDHYHIIQYFVGSPILKQ
jgi:bifunctional NMN adenylyltransferase/nudix hydrolase